MGEPILVTDEIHRQLAVDLFNGTWNLIEKADRSADENRTMVNSAHASLYHWRQVGAPINVQRGEWLIARVYTLLGSCEAARDHADECLRLTEEHNFGGFDLAFAHEAVARAAACSGDSTSREAHYLAAEEAGSLIEDAEDREYFFSDLRSGPWFD